MHSFKVSGMTCRHCVQAVTAAVERIDPAAATMVDLDAGRVTVQGGTAGPVRIAQAIEAEGYPAEPLPA